MHFASNYVYLNSVKNNQHSPNVLAVSFRNLETKQPEQTGDAVVCQNPNCNAIMSHLSQIKEIRFNQIWVCEFCGTNNRVLNLNPSQIPRDSVLTYLIEGNNDPTGPYIDDKYLVFCIDVSGSMATTIRVDESIPEMRTANNVIYDSLLEAGIPPEDLNNQGQNIGKYVSRLDCVKLAIENNLCDMDREKPFKRVCLVAFSDKIRVIGDGKIDETFIEDNNLYNWETIRNKEYLTPRLQCISRTKQNIMKKLRGLQEDGSTALGPALLYSVALASRRRNSQVILCTDGLANVGLGSLENEQDRNESIEFYHKLTELARSRGVSVNIIAISEESNEQSPNLESNLELGLLGEICSKTNGKINLVEPMTLINEFRSIVNRPIVATGVQLKLIVPQTLYIKDYTHHNEQKSCIEKRICNVRDDTEVTFKFDSRMEINATPNIPIQLQITYTDFDGTFTGLRVFTELRDSTNDRERAERNVDVKILAAHAIQMRAHLLNSNEGQILGDFSQYILNLSRDALFRAKFSDINRELEILENRLNEPIQHRQRQFNDQEAAKYAKYKQLTRHYFN